MPKALRWPAGGVEQLRRRPWELPYYQYGIIKFLFSSVEPKYIFIRVIQEVLGIICIVDNAVGAETPPLKPIALTRCFY